MARKPFHLFRPDPPDITSADTAPEDPYLEDYFLEQPGAMPGTLSIEADAPPPTIILIDYQPEYASRRVIETPEECRPYLSSPSVSWIDVQGLGDEDIMRRLGQVFNLHPIVLEDIVNVPQRPKVEDHDDYMVLITRMVSPKEHEHGFYTEQVSFILGKHFLLTVQEEPERDCFNLVRQRIRTSRGMIRRYGPDYLAYALVDAIIDGFYPVLEDYGERIEELEDAVVSKPSRAILEEVHQVRRELLALRRAIWPQRDAINAMIRDPSPLLSEDVRIYLRDCYDHAIQVLDMVETYRELAASLMDVYLSSVGNKMNEIMKVLTIISTIFIPLTFIVGIYGMNFDPEASPWNMPELHWYWGYPLCWLVMITVALSLFGFFWRKGWFQSTTSLDPPDANR
ncbi:magnesium/cobalt transporter CorA [Thermosynechococcaceae cyanobacterium Okahandja]